MTDARERKLEHLKEALDENAGSKALFAAADYAIRMRGDSTAVPQGKISELMQRADEQGSVTPQEIAKILDTDTVAVEYQSQWGVSSE